MSESLSDYYSSFVILSRGLPKFRYCFALADRKKKYKSGGNEVRSSYKSRYGKVKIKFQSGKPSVMHIKHDCTKSKGQEYIENKTTWESPYLLAPSSGYKS